MAADADTVDGELNNTGETAAMAGSHGRSAEPAPAAQPEASDIHGAKAGAFEAPDDTEAHDDADHPAQIKQPMPHVRMAMILGLVIVVALGALSGWLGFQAYQSHHTSAQREVFVQAARQGALNLTTVDWEHVDDDVQRILDSATGAFYDDFSKRSQAFIDVVKQARSKSVGSITEAGLESEADNEAQVLVVARVDISNAGAAEQEPRAWRMRISVQNVDDDAKVSNVAFVP